MITFFTTYFSCMPAILLLSTALVTKPAADEPEAVFQAKHKKLVRAVFYGKFLDNEVNFGFHDPHLNLEPFLHDEAFLHIAALTNNSDFINLMIYLGMDTERKCQGFTPLHVAAFLKNRTVTERLISCGAKPVACDDTFKKNYLQWLNEPLTTVTCFHSHDQGDQGSQRTSARGYVWNCIIRDKEAFIQDFQESGAACYFHNNTPYPIHMRWFPAH